VTTSNLFSEIQVSEVHDTFDISAVPSDISFFEPYLRYHVKEVLEIGGEAFVSRTPEGAVSGIFIYDDAEKSGTIYTRSMEVFDCFFEMKRPSFDFIFSELPTEHENEAYDIYTVNLEENSSAIEHSFSHGISIAEQSQIGKIEQFMALTHPGINKRWVKVALKNGDKCFIVRLDKEIAGVGWVSIANRIGRLHSLYVKPRFWRMGIGEDLLFARLLWLRSKHARSAFSEISHYNSSSSRIAIKGRMKVCGQVFQYFKPLESST
jgi:ribosomal protein S18 acetylase RimI-like enzyme